MQNKASSISAQYKKQWNFEWLSLKSKFRKFEIFAEIRQPYVSVVEMKSHANDDVTRFNRSCKSGEISKFHDLNIVLYLNAAMILCLGF